MVAVNDEIARRLRELTAVSDVRSISPGVSTIEYIPADKAQARQRLGLCTTQPLIGTVGRLNSIKGHAYLIEALTLVDQKVELAIIGDGPEKQSLQSLSHRLGLTQRVHFFGHRDELSQIYPAFDVLCLPSLAEGLPRSMLEAQACGISVVASDVGSISAAIAPHSGYVVPPGDVRALAEALTRCLGQITQPQELHSYIDKNFSLTKTQSQFEKFAGIV